MWAREQGMFHGIRPNYRAGTEENYSGFNKEIIPLNLNEPFSKYVQRAKDHCDNRILAVCNSHV